ncbi:MAG TPA: hypothetical protein VMF89_19470, partial [Polyangiales bacterium]|nr:hypothetical protein [Polyangiales bacterium]
MNNMIRGPAARMWRGSQRTCGLLMLLLGLAVAASSAHAQGKAPSPEYQQLIDRGLAAYQAQRPAEARSLFAQAHALQPGARTLRALGIADLALDNFTMAKDEL